VDIHRARWRLHGTALLRATLLWALASLAIGFAEEFLFRGYPQFILTQGMGFWLAAVCISFLFGASHYFMKPYERWPDWASTSLLARLICLTLRRTGDLRFAIGFHAPFDFGAIFVKGLTAATWPQTVCYGDVSRERLANRR
jgi:CAAX protease family protein